MRIFYYDIPNVRRILVLVLCFFAGVCAIAAQEPVIVQPGAPGQPTRVLPSSTRAKLPPSSKKDSEFMRGMIHHHAQAVEMVDLIEGRTQNRDIRLLGERISLSQMDEMKFMEHWLEVRGEPVSITAAGTQNTNHRDHNTNWPSKNHDQSVHLMPGMLTPKQMDALTNAKGAEFDRLFLKGMIQHHEGALVMVKDLFASPGAGQDAELFNFAADVDSGQRAEIDRMRNLLDKITLEKKP